MPTAPREVAGIILAAGRSARMGRPKQLLSVAGRPLLQHVLDAAVAARLGTIVLVLGHAAAAIRAVLAVPADGRVRVIVNTRYAAGQSTSLQAGLAAVPATAAAAAVMLGDQPALDAAHIDTVLAAFAAAATPIVRPVFADGTPGHPVVLARRVWPQVARLRGDDGARAVIAAHPAWLTTVPVAGAAPPDVDTHADYVRLLGATTTP
jgi:molybdenum cofactor cytidylyltransferase